MKKNLNNFYLNKQANQQPKKIAKKKKNESIDPFEYMFSNGDDHKVNLEILPKNFKYKGKHYIHHAAKQKDLSMLERAIKEGHDLTLLDGKENNQGNNIFYHLFYEEFSFGKKDSKLIDPQFFIKVLKINKDIWNPSKNTFDMFCYFKNKTISILESRKELTYDEEKYKEIMSSYDEFINIFKEFDLKLELSYQDFENIKFNSTIHGKLLENALMIASDKKNCFKFLIHTINLFNTPKPKKVEPKSNQLFQFSAEDFSKHSIIMGTSGSGKSMFLSQQMLNSFVMDENVDDEIIYEMWDKHILRNNVLNKCITEDDELLGLLQKINKPLASMTLQNKLNKILNEKKEEHTRIVKI